jgi:RsiW-degrading membrane proteinase PrsW (M82 family)
MARAPKPDDYLTLPAHALGDEPALGHLDDADLPTFQSIYRSRRAATPRSKMLAAAVLAAVLSGPFAILGALTGTGGALSVVILAVVFAPLVEEMLKVAGALYLTEVRPWLVPSATALVVVAVCSGLVFAAIENAFYLGLIIPDPTPEIVRWRWIFGPLVHGSGSLLAGIGVARMWHGLDAHGRRPNFRVAAPWIIAATLLHGGYNLFATWLELFGGGV